MRALLTLSIAMHTTLLSSAAFTLSMVSILHTLYLHWRSRKHTRICKRIYYICYTFTLYYCLYIQYTWMCVYFYTLTCSRMAKRNSSLSLASFSGSHFRRLCFCAALYLRVYDCAQFSRPLISALAFNALLLLLCFLLLLLLLMLMLLQCVLCLKLIRQCAYCSLFQSQSQYASFQSFATVENR